MVTYSPRVVSYYPRSPKPALLVIGEAPGPRGANRTGYPFWGDDCGLQLYRLVGELGLLDEPFTPWQLGIDLSGTQPPSGCYAITNACPQMPVRDSGRFCAPAPSRLDAEAPRLLDEMRTLQPKVVIACGKSAAYTLARAAFVEGSTPPPPLATSLGGIKLLAAMRALVSGAGEMHWRVGGAVAFVTTHPARGQWAPSKESGRLHAEVIKLMQSAI